MTLLIRNAVQLCGLALRV